MKRERKEGREGDYTLERESLQKSSLGKTHAHLIDFAGVHGILQLEESQLWSTTTLSLEAGRDTVVIK